MIQAGANSPGTSGEHTVRVAAVFLGVVALMCIGAIGFLSWSRTPPPDALAGVCGAAVGALATLLTTSASVAGGRRLTDDEAVRRMRFDESLGPLAAKPGQPGPLLVPPVPPDAAPPAPPRPPISGDPPAS